MNKVKQFIFLIVILVSANDLYSQSVKFKNDKVIVGGEECLIHNSSDANNIEFTTKDGQQTIFLKFIRTGIGQNRGLYTKVIFVEQNKSLTSRSFIFSRKLLVNKLLSEKVIVDCEIKDENIDKFIMKYDDKIEEALIRL